MSDDDVLHDDGALDARAYLNSLSAHPDRIGDTSRLHPEMARRVAAAIQQARAAGLNVNLSSGWRSPNQTGSNYDASGYSLHDKGGAVDIGGLGYAGSPATTKWAQIASQNGLFNPYGADHAQEFNHWQLVPYKIEQRPDIQRQIAAAGGDQRAIWGAIMPVKDDVPDLLGQWKPAGAKNAPATTQPPSGKSTAPATDDVPDLLGQWKPTPAATAAQAAPAPIKRAVPGDAKPGPNGLLWNGDGGFDPQTGALLVSGKSMGSAPSQVLAGASGVVSGVPIAGAPLLAATQKGAAIVSALQPSAPDNALSQAQAANQDYIDRSQAAYPATTTAGQVGGGIVGTVPLMAAAPAAFGIGEGSVALNALRSAGTGAVISGADAGARGGDADAMQQAAKTGGFLGLLGPAAGRLAGAGVDAAGVGGSVLGHALGGGVAGGAVGGVGAGVQSGGFNPMNWNPHDVAVGAGIGAAAGAGLPVLASGAGYAANALSRTTPEARYVLNALSEAGYTPEQARAKLAAMGPNAMVADLGPSLADVAGGLASKGGVPTATLKAAALERAAGADDRMANAVNETLGPKPDAEKILSDIRAREGSMATDKDAARAALDASMGASKDPHTELQTMVKERSAAAQPLYEKAMEGGSMASLTHHFEQAFGEAVNTSSQAAQDLAAARQQQLLARAQVSRAGENVYANNSALEASRQADAAVAQAEKAAAAADANKRSIVDRLRQAQADGSANAKGAVWNPRIQQFLDDPVMKAGLAKGVRIQRLESLAEGKPFDPTEHAIVGQDEAGNPIVGKVPNMKTLQVAKEGLDQMVEEAKDPNTGQLTKEGRAIDKVRGAFLEHLDDINPDYKVARQSWAGPTQAHEAFNKGLSIFQNRSGPSGVNSTPGALDTWLKGASEGEKEAAKLGARSAFEQQMAAASDPASKAAALANKEVNAQKLTAILGKDEADKLTSRLNFVYEDPAGAAFERGMGLFKQREGVAGIQDTPDAWRSWLSKASPSEKEATRHGARQAIEQAITSARQGDVSAARSLFAKSTANREKLEAIFPQASKLFDTLDNELRMRATEQNIAAGSQTASRRAVQEQFSLPQAGSGGTTTAAIIGDSLSHGLSEGFLPAALAGAQKGFSAARNALQQHAISRLAEGTARGLSATGALQQQFLREIENAGRSKASLNALSNASEAGTNLLTRSAGNALSLP